MSRFRILLTAYLNDSISREELTELIALTDADESLLKESILDDLRLNSFAGLTDAGQRQKMYTAICNRTRHRSVIHLWTRVAAAAVIIITLGVGSYFLFGKQSKQIAKTETEQQKLKNDIAPGGNKAILTLANGQKIILDSAANGTLSQQGNTKIIKLDSGQLAYQSSGHPEPIEGYNTISTPRGGQYQVVLSDGSKVWLNAASSLKYPTSFNGKDRKVELTGEGYFEVAHDAAKPFKVAVNGIAVQVLGTHFNINAYDDESVIKTTLLKGSVKITRGGESSLLTPGKQAIVNLSQPGEAIRVINTDVEEAVAWKNGKFQFGEGSDIAAVMRQIARWYDVDIEYKGTVTGHIGGTISRNVNASQVFRMLEMTGSVKFRIEGKKVIVMQ